MEFRQEGYERKQVHGTDPQFLIEKIIRERIYECLYWKEKLFAANAEIVADRAIDLRYIGGQYGNQRPTDFLACTLKLLQIQPEEAIVDLFLEDQDFKYMTALGAFYWRFVASPVQVYKKLEPLLLDRRKLRMRLPNGTFEITFMDQFIDDLLNEERVLDCILPRLPKRYLLEDSGELDPRISPLEDELEDLEDEPEEEEAAPEPEVEEKVIEISEIDPLHKKKKKYSSKKVKGLFKKVEKKKAESEEEDTPGPGFRDGSLSIHETNILRANLGLKPLQP